MVNKDREGIKLIPKNVSTTFDDGTKSQTAFFHYKLIAFEMNFAFGYKSENVEGVVSPNDGNITKLDVKNLLSKLLISNAIWDGKEDQNMNVSPDGALLRGYVQTHPVRRSIDTKLPYLLAFMGYTPTPNGIHGGNAQADLCVSLRDETLERYIKSDVLTQNVLDLAMFLYSPVRFKNKDTISAIEFNAYPFQYEIDRARTSEGFTALLQKHAMFHTYSLINKFKILYNTYKDRGKNSAFSIMKYLE